jgi:hypothetical protein
MPADEVAGIKTSCSFDMCALEGKAELDAFRCNVYSSFVSTCLKFADKNGKTFNFGNWRDTVKCRNIFNLR